MATIDLAPVTQLAAQKQALLAQAAVATDPTVKALLTAQANALDAQINMALAHAQSQIDSTNSFLDQMGLWSTITQATQVGLGTLPNVIALFRH
jgi:hypothetical protein